MTVSRTQSQMTSERRSLLAVKVFAVSLMLLPISVLNLSTSNVFANEVHYELLSGVRILFATVEEVKSGEAKVDTGEMQPRYLPMNFRKAKGLPALKKGDRVEIVVNDQNLIVDIHLLGHVNTKW
jgi:hypothetical protein